MRNPILDNFLANHIPLSDIEFVSILSEKVLQDSHSLEDLLVNASKTFGEKEYGIREAVDQGISLRYPGEIKRQRFCAEEALKNYLLARSLGFEVSYLRAENFKGRGLSHDVVLVHSPSPAIMDWGKIVKIRMDREGLHSSEDETLLASSFLFIPEERLLREVNQFRPANQILTLLNKPQLLANHKTESGEIEIYVRMLPRQLEFLHFATDFALELPSYYRRRVSSSGVQEEWGIARGRIGMFYEEVPIAYRSNSHLFFVEFMQGLKDGERRVLTEGLLYHHYCQENGGNSLFGASEREEILLILSENKSAAQHLDFYRALQSECPQSMAEKYLDIVGFKLSLACDYEGSVNRVLRKFRSRFNWFEGFYQKYQLRETQRVREESGSDIVERKLLALTSR